MQVRSKEGARVVNGALERWAFKLLHALEVAFFTSR